MVRAAWDSVTAETVVNRGGFSLPSEVMGSLEEDMDPDLQEQEEEQVSLDFLNLKEGCTCTFEEYVHCDSSLQCAPMLTSQDIVSSATQNPAKDDTDDVGDPLPIVSFQQAHSSFLNIKAFLFRTTSSSNADQVYHLLRDLEMERFKHFKCMTF